MSGGVDRDEDVDRSTEATEAGGLDREAGPVRVDQRTTRERVVEIVGGIRAVYGNLDASARISVWILLAVTFAAAFAPMVAPYNPTAPDYEASLQGPSVDHPLGTDLTGRDVLSRLIFGGRVSLAVGVGAVLLGVGVGVPIGAVAGYRGGWTGEALMRAMDVVISFPALILALALVGVLGANFLNLVLVIGIVYSPQYARLVHGQVLSVKEETYVEAAENTGLAQRSVLFGHVLPNAMTPVIVQATFHVALAIILEASLSFLGLGIQPPTPTWGVMIANGRQYLPAEWWISTFPGLAIMMTVLAFNLLGDGLRDEYDPRTVTKS
jgi:ABC-type dipeptide/oligopeptide/nickel transport system permease subunit